MKHEYATPEIRFNNLLAFFGWTGGTIHQVADETGVDAYSLLHGRPDDGQEINIASDFHKGGACLETCDLDWRLRRVIERKGNRNWWIGVARANSMFEGRHIDHGGEIVS